MIKWYVTCMFTTLMWIVTGIEAAIAQTNGDFDGILTAEVLAKWTYPDKGTSTLYLSNLNISSIQPKAFINQNEVVDALYLSNNILKRIDNVDTFTGLPNLETLNLQSNRIEFLGTSIFAPLKNLEYINLNNNKLLTLDSSLFKDLKFLSFIDLSFNSLNSIQPNLISHLATRLTQLSLNSNRLTTLNVTLFKGFGALSRLRLDRNSLQNIAPACFGSLTNVAYLWLNNNPDLIVTPNHFVNMTSLKFLYLKNNGEVTTTNFRNQSISVDLLLDFGYRFDKTKSIDWSSMRIKTLLPSRMQPNPTSAFNGFMYLEDIKLKYNLISTLESDIFSGLNTLVLLDLSYNLLTSTWLSRYAFRGLTNLRKLHLDGNKLTTIRSDLFKGLGKLEELTLSVNDIVNIENQSFETLDVMRMLDLSNNKLLRITSAMLYFPVDRNSKLTDLRLYANQIEEIDDDSFCKLKNIETVYLKSNPISISHTDDEIKNKVCCKVKECEVKLNLL